MRQDRITEEQAKAKIADAMNGLEPELQQRVLARVMERFDGTIKSVATPAIEVLEEDMRDDERVVAQSKEQIAALESLLPWTQKNDYRLERNDCSRLHKLVEASVAGKVVRRAEDAGMSAKAQALLFLHSHVFVVQHDWGAAFDNAVDYTEGEFKLPFAHCAFELRIGGRTVIVIAMQPEGEGVTAIPFVECPYQGWWWCSGQDAREQPVMQYAWKQIRAISIALDAEVASRDLVRAPVALNEKRTKKGEIPLFDYHVVKLHGRIKHQRAPGTGTHRSPRLHFRRGHWRHYEQHKTWIRWTLVGDPELGFIDKSYRL